MEASKKVMEIGKIIVDTIDNAEKSKLIEMFNDDFFSGSINIDCLNSKYKDIDVTIFMKEKQSEIDDLSNAISKIDDTINSMEAPLLFGKKEFHEKLNGLKSERDQKNEQLDILKNQYEYDINFIDEQWDLLGEDALDILLDKITYKYIDTNGMSADEVREKNIEVLKNVFHKYNNTFQSIGWKQSLGFFYFVAFMLTQMNGDEEIVIEGKPYNLLDCSYDICLDIIRTHEKRYEKNIKYWVAKFLTLESSLFVDKEISPIIQKTKDLWKRYGGLVDVDNAKLNEPVAEYIDNYVVTSFLLKKTLRELRESVNIGLGLSLQQDNKDFIELFEEFRENRIVNGDIGWLIKISFLDAKE